MLIRSEKKWQQNSKQVNLYGKLTKVKSNLNSNWIFFKLKFIYIYIYIYYLVSNEPYIVIVMVYYHKETKFCKDVM